MKMGMQFGLESGNHAKRKFRWLFTIPDVTVEENDMGIAALPPSSAARPNLQFKEMSVKHVIEDVYYPAKPDWKPVSLSLYDMSVKVHPVFKWINQIYDPQEGRFEPPNSNYNSSRNKFIKEATLSLYDGCGTLIERWIWEDAWLQSANFQTLDMSDSGIVMCDITMRYARAYIEKLEESISSPSDRDGSSPPLIPFP